MTFTAKWEEKEYNLTLNKIGSALGNRDHATISHSLEKISQEKETNENIKQDIDNVVELLDKMYSKQSYPLFHIIIIRIINLKDNKNKGDFYEI